MCGVIATIRPAKSKPSPVCSKPEIKLGPAESPTIPIKA